jgi:prevent-host-death family protein
MNHHSKIWPLNEAKAKFSELVRLAQTEGPQTVSVHGEPAVVISKALPKPDSGPGLTGAELIRFLRQGPLFDFELPPRPKSGAYDNFSFDDENDQS